MPTPANQKEKNLFTVMRDTRRAKGARISVVDRLEYFLRSRASKVVLALVTNTMVA